MIGSQNKALTFWLIMRTIRGARRPQRWQLESHFDSPAEETVRLDPIARRLQP